MTKLKFSRKLAAAQPAEQAALKAIPGVGTWYDKVETGRVERQMTVPGEASLSTIAVFFRLEDPYGAFHIEMALPFIFDFYNHALWIPPSADGTVNATITDELVNGAYVIVSTIDGQIVRFTWEPQWSFYVPDNLPEDGVDDYVKKAKGTAVKELTKAA